MFPLLPGRRRGALTLFSCLLLVSGHAVAHVGLEWPAATAGAAYKATFQVGHGCDGSPTRAVGVDIPAGVVSVRPMPRPGWALTLDRAPASATASGAAGPVVRVTWTAKTPSDALLDAHYDEFVLRAVLPDQEGPLYWPVRQLCEQGRLDWVEVPARPDDKRSLRYPAVRLDLMPASGAAHRH